MKNFKLQTTDKIILLALLLLCLISFYPIYNAEYLRFDDNNTILNCDLIKQPLSIESLMNIFSEFTDNQYTPISILSFWLEYNIFLDFNSGFSHCVNLFFHILAVIALYYLSLDFFKDKKFAFFFTAFWAIHPIQVVSVAWLTGRRTVLYGLFFIASLLFYCKYVNTQKNTYKYLAILTMILSGLSKTLSFTAPIVWIGIDWLKDRKISYKLITEKIPAFIISFILISTMFISANKGINRTTKSNIDYHYKEALYSISYYAIQTVFPHKLSATNELNSNTKTVLDYTYLYFGLFIVLSIIISIKSKLALWGLCFYIFHIIPLSGLIRVGYSFFISYHYCYIPLLGLLLIFIEGIRLLSLLFKFNKIKELQIAVLFIFCLMFGFKTNIFSIAFKSTESLLLNSINIDSNNYFATNNLIKYYIDINNLEQAKIYCNKLLKCYPDSYGAYSLKGQIETKEEKYEEAILLFEKCKELDFENKDKSRYFYQAYCYIKLQKWEKAEHSLTEQIEKIPFYAYYYMLRSVVYQKLGKYSLAYKDLLTAISLDPQNFENKVKLYQNSMQMMNYYQSILDLIEIYTYINNQPEYIKNYSEVLFFPSFKESLLQCFPYYFYIDNLLNKYITVKKT